ncbi:MAG: hypothetical protein PWP51_1804 [Clostridiales bacterium]|jgi:hypothetical protein|nr:hypothetical protein [Clostridiales bacterium]MDN5299251.1 hypothetical protein [Clostridiales bacterium]
MENKKSMFNLAANVLVALSSVIITSISFVFFGEPNPPQ